MSDSIIPAVPHQGERLLLPLTAEDFGPEFRVVARGGVRLSLIHI